MKKYVLLCLCSFVCECVCVGKHALGQSYQIPPGMCVCVCAHLVLCVIVKMHLEHSRKTLT